MAISRLVSGRNPVSRKIDLIKSQISYSNSNKRPSLIDVPYLLHTPRGNQNVVVCIPQSIKCPLYYKRTLSAFMNIFGIELSLYITHCNNNFNLLGGICYLHPMHVYIKGKYKRVVEAYISAQAQIYIVMLL